MYIIAYCEKMVIREDQMNHGQRSAAIARPLLETLGLSSATVNDICYGIAIHLAHSFYTNRGPCYRGLYDCIVGKKDITLMFGALCKNTDYHRVCIFYHMRICSLHLQKQIHNKFPSRLLHD